MDHSLQLKYQRNYSIIINDCDVSLFYYFDYGERYKQINMEFQHSHRFHEIMIPLSPDAIHLLKVCHILLRKATLCCCRRLFFIGLNIRLVRQAND